MSHGALGEEDITELLCLLLFSILYVSHVVEDYERRTFFCSGSNNHHLFGIQSICFVKLYIASLGSSTRHTQSRSL